MTALNFPASPSSGDVHNAANGLQYAFDGVKWTSQGTYDTGAINAQKLDDIDTSAQPFNGSNTTFALKVNGNTIKPHNEQSLSIVLNGHLQEPVTAYTISQANGTITFATAPAQNTPFFGVLLSRLPVAGSILDGSVTNVKVASDAAIDGTKINPNFGNQTITGVTATQAAGDNTTKLASTAFVSTAIANLIDSSPATLDTLNELAAAINDDNDFHTTITTALGTKAPTNNPTFTGTVSGISYNDLDNKPTIPSNVSDLTNDSGFISATLTDEQVQDIVGGMVSGNTESGISVTYDDAGNNTGKLNFSVSNTNTGNQTWNDDAKAIFGTSGDGLEIYHDGINSIIDDKGTGGLLIYGSDIILEKHVDSGQTSERMADFAQDGSARLYFNGGTTPKLATSGTGVTVSGTVTATAFSGDGSNLTGITSSSLDSSIQLTSSNISDAFGDTNQLVLGNGANDNTSEGNSDNDDALVLYYGTGSGTNYGVISADNGVHIQFDGANRLETHSAGTKWQSDLFCDDGNKIKLGNQSALQIHHSVDGGNENSFIDARGDSNSNNGGLLFYAKDFIFHEQSNGNHRMAAFAQDGGDGARLYYDNDIKIQTTDYGISTKDIVVTSNQNEKLALAGSSNPFIRFREGTTNKAYIQWLDTGVLQIVNEESGEILKIHDGNNGLTYTVDGTERTVYHTGNLTPFSGNYNDLSNKPTNVSTFTNDAGYLTSAPAPTASQINTAFPDNGNLILGTGTGTDTLKLYYDGTNAKITSDNAIHLQHDGANKLEVSSSGVKWVGDLFCDDLQKIKLGSSADLQIYHDNTGSGNSIIEDSGAGALLIYGSDIIIQKSGSSSRMADFAQDGAVRLYENGTIRLTTTNAGVDVSGNIVVSGNVDGRDVAADGTKLDGIESGATADQTAAEIRSLVESASDSNVFTDADHTKLNNIGANANNYSLPIATNSVLGGIKVGNNLSIDASTGVLSASASAPTASTINALYPDNGNLILGTGSGDDTLKLYYDGTNAKINTDNALHLQQDGANKVEISSAGTKWIGTLFCDDNQSLKLGSSADLHLSHDSTNSYIDNSEGALNIRLLSNATSIQLIAGSDYMARFVKNGASELYHANDKVLNTITNGIQVDDATKIYENSTHNTAVIQHGDIHHSIILRGSTNANGSTITNANVTTFREYGNFVFRTGPINAQERFIIEAGGTSKFVKNNEGSSDENIAQFIPDGSVKLYYDNNLRFETASAGVKWFGDLFCDSDNRLKIGNSAALQIYHDSTSNHSYITEGGSGNLYIQGNNLVLENTSGANYFAGISGAEAQLFYNGNKKFETTNTGVYVTGNITLSGTVDGRDLVNDGSKLDGIASNANNYSLPTASASTLGGIKVGSNLSISNGVLSASASGGGASGFDFNDNVRIKFGADDDLQLFHDTNNSVIDGTGTGSLLLYGSDIIFQEKSDGSHRMADFAQDGSTGVRLYYDNGVKLQTTSSGIAVGNITVSTSQDEKLILTGSNNPYIRFREGSTNKAYIQWSTDGFLHFVNQESGEILRIKSGNNGLTFVVDGTERTVYHTGNLPTIPTNNNQLTNGAGYVTTDTTYSVGDGGLTQKNFTTTLKNKLDGIAANANNYSFPYTISQSASNGTVVRRNDSGYIFANYFNTSPNDVTSGVTKVCVETANDGYIRHGTPAAIRSFINVADGANNYSFPYTISASAGNNTVVLRHSSGYIFSNYINTTDNSVTGSISAIMCKQSGQGDYHRSATAAAVRSFINVENGATADQTASDINALYPDNGNLILGTGSGSDTMKMYYNGTSGVITANNGVYLQHDGAAKIYTRSDGCRLNGKIYIGDDSRYVRPVGAQGSTGNYGSISCHGANGGWAGYNIDNRVVFMHNGSSSWGIYNDANNEWLIYGLLNSYTQLRWNGATKLETVNYGVIIVGTCRPHTTNGGDSGASDARWGTVYASNGSINTSDRNEKNSILEADLGLDFINKLKPVSYKWNDTRLGKKQRYGLIAQDIEETIKEIGKDVDDIGMIDKPEEGAMGLNYNELIAPLVKSIQELSAKVAALEAA